MKEFWEAIDRAKTIALCGHIRPDGDCIGSCMGLYGYIMDNFSDKKVWVYLDEIPDSFLYLKDEEASSASLSSRATRSTRCSWICRSR